MQPGHIPIVAGGTGFYIQALLYDIDFTEKDEDTATAETLGSSWRRNMDSAYLHEMLREVDPVSAEMIHANNVKRVIRALEYFQKTGRTNFQTQRRRTGKRISISIFVYFVLT